MRVCVDEGRAEFWIIDFSLQRVAQRRAIERDAETSLIQALGDQSPARQASSILLCTRGFAFTWLVASHVRLLAARVPRPQSFLATGSSRIISHSVS